MRFSRAVPGGGAVIGGHAGSENAVQPFTDRLAVVAVRSTGALIGWLLARAASMDRPYTFKEIGRIVAGAVISLVIVGWLVFLAIGYLSAR